MIFVNQEKMVRTPTMEFNMHIYLPGLQIVKIEQNRRTGERGEVPPTRLSNFLIPVFFSRSPLCVSILIHNYDAEFTSAWIT